MKRDRLLIIDDDKKMLKLLKDFLELENYSIITAENGTAALQKLSAS